MNDSNSSIKKFIVETILNLPGIFQIKKWNIKRQEELKKFAETIKNKIENVEISEEKLNIPISLINNLNINWEEVINKNSNFLKEIYQNLLINSLTKEKQKNIRIDFVNIISRLDWRDAEMMNFLYSKIYKSKIESLYTFQKRIFLFENKLITELEAKRIINSSFKYVVLNNVFNYKLNGDWNYKWIMNTISHLESLGLIKSSYPITGFDDKEIHKEEYLNAINNEYFINYINDICCDVKPINKNEFLKEIEKFDKQHIYQTIEITKFGESFLLACDIENIK